MPGTPGLLGVCSITLLSSDRAPRTYRGFEQVPTCRTSNAPILPVLLTQRGREPVFRPPLSSLVSLVLGRCIAGYPTVLAALQHPLRLTLELADPLPRDA